MKDKRAKKRTEPENSVITDVIDYLVIVRPTSFAENPASTDKTSRLYRAITKKPTFCLKFNLDILESCY